MSENGFRFGAVSTAAIRDRRVTHAQLRVLAELSTFADEGGWCFPRQALMAEHLGMSASAIQGYLRTLRTLGYVEVEAQYRDDGGRRANRYKVRLDGGVPQDIEGTLPQMSEGGDPQTSRGAITDHENTPEEQTTESANALPQGEKPKKERARNPLFDALVIAFGEASTTSRAAFYGRTVRELNEAGASPEQVVAARAEMAKRGWTNPTPEAMVKHWDDLLRQAKVKERPGSKWDLRAEREAAR